MILHELREYARREGLVDDPAFESKPVPWIIVLDEEGSYLGLRDTYQDVPVDKKGRPKRQAAMFSIHPERHQVVAGILALLHIDRASTPSVFVIEKSDRSL